MISQSVIDDTSKAICQNEKAMNEELKKFNSELQKIKRSHFNFLANAVIYIFVGVVIAVLVYFGFWFLRSRQDELKELAESSARTSVERQAVKNYRDELLNADGKELSKIIDEWKNKNGK